MALTSGLWVSSIAGTWGSFGEGRHLKSLC